MNIKPPLDLASASDSLRNSKRILILGAPGSGKSYTAEKLAQLLKLPSISLDLFFWKPEWKPVPLEDFKKFCLVESQKDQWIMDGNYGTTFEERWARADFVLYINTNPWLAFFRQILRTLGLAKGIARPEGCKERANHQLFWLTYKFRKSHGVLIKERMRGLYPDMNFFEVKNKRELRKLLNSLS